MFNWRITLLLFLTLASTGCKSLDLSDRFSLKRAIPWKSGEKESRQGIPVRIVATWTDAVLHKPNQAERGFGGRLYFYDNKGSDPIEVEGRLVVYAFDETGRDPTDNRPNRRYVFPPEQFELHEDETELGISYSVWLPWDSAQNGPPADVSLIARFEPVGKGNLITSDQTRQRLPGQGPLREGEASIAQESTQPGVQRASVSQSTIEPERKTVHQINYETTVDHISEPTASPARMTTTTISLPGKFRKESAIPPAPAGQPAAEISVPATPAPNVRSAADINLEGTQVTMLTPGESVRQSIQRRSFGSPPASLPAPATPASP